MRPDYGDMSRTAVASHRVVQLPRDWLCEVLDQAVASSGVAAGRFLIQVEVRDAVNRPVLRGEQHLEGNAEAGGPDQADQVELARVGEHRLGDEGLAGVDEGVVGR